MNALESRLGLYAAVPPEYDKGVPSYEAWMRAQADRKETLVPLDRIQEVPVSYFIKPRGNKGKEAPTTYSPDAQGKQKEKYDETKPYFQDSEMPENSYGQGDVNSYESLYSSPRASGISGELPLTKPWQTIQERQNGMQSHHILPEKQRAQDRYRVSKIIGIPESEYLLTEKTLERSKVDHISEHERLMMMSHDPKALEFLVVMQYKKPEEPLTMAANMNRKSYTEGNDYKKEKEQANLLDRMKADYIRFN